MLNRRWMPLAGAVAVSLCAWSMPKIAHACGGTFCDGGGPPMPVDQTGEDVIFVMDGNEVEAHVRIQYEGEAEIFAWVVPLQAVPEVSVGSDLLFQAMSAATIPSFNLQTDFEECAPPPGDGDGDSGDGFAPKLDSGVDPGPDVLLETVVGAFDVVVLQGGTAEEVINWLDSNGYAQDDQAEPILQEYLDEGYLFAAIKLTGGTDVDEIHPIVFKYAGDEPCIPLRLTRIAASEDMGVRAYFLGNERAFPSSYEHVVMNQAKLNWLNIPQNYNDVLSGAVDEAGGRAFVTDYAGPSFIVSQDGIYSELWNEQAFVGLDPTLVVDTLESQGLMSCPGEWECSTFHPLVMPLLLEYLPVPEGLSPEEFWSDLATFAAQIDQAAWDGQAFADKMAERIVEPGVHSVDLLEAWPYLTRLNTLISPHEMTADPFFLMRDDLDDVPNNWLTDRTVFCDGDQLFSFPNDSQLCLPGGFAWGDATGDMPNAERVEMIPPMGPPQVMVDNSEEIADALQTWNENYECLAGGGGDGDGDGDGDSLGDGDGDGDGDVATTGPSSMDSNSSSSCACTTSPNAGWLGMLAVFGLLTLRPRRRD